MVHAIRTLLFVHFYNFSSLFLYLKILLVGVINCCLILPFYNLVDLSVWNLELCRNSLLFFTESLATKYIHLIYYESVISVCLCCDDTKASEERRLGSIYICFNKRIRKAHSHEHEITNETSDDKSAQHQPRRQFIHTARSAGRNVDESWRCC